MTSLLRVAALIVAFAAIAVTIGATACSAADADAAARRHIRKVHANADCGEALRLRAVRGDDKAQTLLGFCYASGRGVPQSRGEAAAWYARAAAQGNADAQYLLGMAYDKGHGIERDVVQAYKWLNLAAARAGKRSRKYYVLIRDAVASKLTAAQLAAGQSLANEWQPSRLNSSLIRSD